MSTSSVLSADDTDNQADLYVATVGGSGFVVADTSALGAKANGPVSDPSISADGTRVAFVSTATNLVPGDTDSVPDVYVKDLVTGAIYLVSTSDSGVKGNLESGAPSISDDGTKVAFMSRSGNLDPADLNGDGNDIYVKNLTTNDISLASSTSAGVKENGSASDPSLAGNGGSVAFTSTATNLSAADTATDSDVYVKDLTSGAVSLVSSTTTGTKGNGQSFRPSLSGDGATVAFDSFSTNLDAADTDTTSDVYLKNLASGTLTLASTADDGTKGNSASTDPMLNADGTKVAFGSRARNLDPEATQGAFLDAFVKDLVTGDIVFASSTDSGKEALGNSFNVSLSGSGATVAFDTTSGGLDPADGDAVTDVYLKNLGSGDIILVSDAGPGTRGGDSQNPQISADGSHIAFETQARDLAPSKTTTTKDIVVMDVSNNSFAVASSTAGGTTGNFDSTLPSISADGATVAFQSDATNLLAADNDSFHDIYVKNLQTGALALADTSDSGTKATGNAFRPSLSLDGSAVAFDTIATNIDPADTDVGLDVYVKRLASGDLVLASTSALGANGDGLSTGASISANGQIVAFASTATNLSPADTDSTSDIYVKNLATGAIVVASTSAGGVKANGRSDLASISADGTRVAFQSTATNLSPDDTDTNLDIYVKDLTTGAVYLASTNDAGVKSAGAQEGEPFLSPAGDRVTWFSRVNDLDPEDTTGAFDIYVKDLATNDIEVASTTNGGGKANGDSRRPSISEDGALVAFDTTATNVDPRDIDPDFDLYLKHLAAPDTTDPLAGTVSDGTGADIDTQSSTSQLEANWSGFSDDTAIDHYVYGASSSGSCATRDVVADTDVGTATSHTATSLSLTDGSIYYSCVTAFDAAGNSSPVTASDGVQVVVPDTTDPLPGTVIDGNGVTDVDTQSSASELDSSWSGFSDDTGIDHYVYGASTSSTCATRDVVADVNVGTATTHAATSLSLTDGSTYYSCVEAFDPAGNSSGVIASDGVTVDVPDTIDPLPGTVNDGSGSDVDTQTSTSQLDANWSGFSDDTGVDHYVYGASSSSSCATRDVVADTDAGTATSHTATGLSLTVGSTYYSCVAAFDAAGNSSVVVASDGVVVFAPPPATTTLRVGGDWQAVSPATLKLRATLSDTSTTCDVSGRSIDFYVDANRDGAFASGELVGTAATIGTSNSATAETSPLTIPVSVGLVKAAFAGTTSCAASADANGALVVASAGDTSNGAGQYRLPLVTGPSGLASFAFRTYLDGRLTRGDVVIQQSGTWFLSGSITSFSIKGKRMPMNGQASGTGSLRCWDGTTGAWVVADSSVTFKLAFQDAGVPSKPGQVRIDKMTINSIGSYTPSNGCPAVIGPFLQSKVQDVTAGGIAIKP